MLRIGPLQLRTNLLLAPIAGYCDLAFRTVCREMEWNGQTGLGLACTDLLSPQGLLRGTATSLDLAQTNEFDKPIGMQLYGCDPSILADGARWARDHGASLIDINMGCPVDKVTKKDGGSRLLCIPDIAERIVEEVVKAVGPSSGGPGLPVTCKMRLGWFNDRPAIGACRRDDDHDPWTHNATEVHRIGRSSGHPRGCRGREGRQPGHAGDRQRGCHRACPCARHAPRNGLRRRDDRAGGAGTPLDLPRCVVPPDHGHCSTAAYKGGDHRPSQAVL
jgi:hypothetical protein